MKKQFQELTPEHIAEAKTRMAARRASIADAVAQVALLPAWKREAYKRAFEVVEQEARFILATNRW